MQQETDLDYNYLQVGEEQLEHVDRLYQVIVHQSQVLLQEQFSVDFMNQKAVALPMPYIRLISKLICIS